MLMVFNKIDRLDDVAARKPYFETEYPDSAWISAQEGEGLDHLKLRIYEELEGQRVTLNLRVPQSEGKLLSELHRMGEILSTEYDGNDVLLELKIGGQEAERLLPKGLYQV